MARRRFYALPDDISDGFIKLSTEETHHLVRVLRLRPGDEVSVFDGAGREYICKVAAELNRSARLEIVSALTDRVESSHKITLAQALAKGEKFDLIVQKATELGVRRIVPLLTEHTDVKPGAERFEKRLERWRRISLESLKQCGRRRLVDITAPRTVAQLLDSTTSGTLLLFSERGGLPLGRAIAEAADLSQTVALVGPEGGWSAGELDLFQERGVKAVTLGPRVLRTETAAVVAVALLQHALGDLSRTDEP